MFSVQGGGHPAGFLLPLTFNPCRKLNIEGEQTHHSFTDEHSEHLHWLRWTFIIHIYPISMRKLHISLALLHFLHHCIINSINPAGAALKHTFPRRKDRSWLPMMCSSSVDWSFWGNTNRNNPGYVIAFSIGANVSPISCEVLILVYRSHACSIHDHTPVTINVKYCPPPEHSQANSMSLQQLWSYIHAATDASLDKQWHGLNPHPGGRSHDAIMTYEIDLSLMQSNCPQLQPQRSYRLLFIFNIWSQVCKI